MPELVEVESSRNWLTKCCVGATISSVTVCESGGGPRDGQFDDIVFERVSDNAVRDALLARQRERDRESSAKDGKRKRTNSSSNSDDTTSEEKLYELALLGRRLTAVHRKGKQLWWTFDDHNNSNNSNNNNDNSDNSEDAESVKVLFHFGMTGSFVIQDQPVPCYKSFKISSSEETPWPPRFAKIEIAFDSGVRVAFCDPRRLARIRLRIDVRGSSPVKDLARDPVLDELPSPETLKAELSKYTASVKAILLDQEKIFCGIGNYLADEMLYQSGIHPETRACDINLAGCAQFLRKMNEILTIAIAADAEYRNFPEHWLFHNRWDKAKANGGEKVRTSSGEAIVFETHGGRTSAVVPSAQPKNGYYFTKYTPEALSATNNNNNNKRKQSKRKEDKSENSEDVTQQEKPPKKKKGKSEDDIPEDTSEDKAAPPKQPLRRSSRFFGK